MTSVLRDLLLEGKRKRRSNERDICTLPSFIDDLKKYANDSQVIDRVEEIMNLFRNRKDSELGKPEYHDHELVRYTLKGHRSIRLGIRNIVMVYKPHRNGNQIDFHRIDSHEDVYSPEYEAKERERQKQRYRRED